MGWLLPFFLKFKTKNLEKHGQESEKTLFIKKDLFLNKIRGDIIINFLSNISTNIKMTLSKWHILFLILILNYKLILLKKFQKIKILLLKFILEKLWVRTIFKDCKLRFLLIKREIIGKLL